MRVIGMQKPVCIVTVTQVAFGKTIGINSDLRPGAAQGGGFPNALEEGRGDRYSHEYSKVGRGA